VTPPGAPAHATSASAHRPSSEATSGQAPAAWRSAEEAFSIPAGYGDDRIVLMVKDPWWLYAYWEVQPSTERAARGQLAPQEVAGLQTVLRVYDVTDLGSPDDGAPRSFDIPLSGLATNWYIHTNAPTRSFVVEIGLLTAGGRFLRLARSNRVTAPRAGPSDVVDETWMTTDEEFWKLLGRSTGIGIGSSPGRIEWLPQQLFSWSWSSPTVFGPHRRAAVRGFWYRVNTDLVIHGATEPRATVVVQGQPVVVRKDGTFSLRLALPEGTQTVTIDVTSPDGQQTRTISPVVTLALSGPLTGSATTATKRQVARSRPTTRGRPAPGVAPEPGAGTA